MSKYWFACFTLADGSRTQRSTRSTDRRAAQKIADEFESAARQRATARQAQRVIADIFHRQTGSTLPSGTTRQYFTSWLARKKPETAPSTYSFYAAKAKRFLNWLGDAADAEISLIDSGEIYKFRTAEIERVSASTVNHEVKFLRMVFEQAKRDGVIADNPADSVNVVKRNGRTRRRPFTLAELKRLLAIADDEWRSLILFGLYTGQRLGDLALLTWANVDLQNDEIRFVTNKTGRRQIIPMAPPLRRHIEGLTAGDNPRQPLHPRAFASAGKSGKVGTLSRQFYELMADAGMVPQKRHRAATGGLGRDGRREISEISFHALRHTATSLMKNAGISAAIVQDIIGHDSEAVSANYTHIDEVAKRTALRKMPDVVGG